MTTTLAFYKGRLADNPKALLGDRAIAWWTRGPFSHVEIVRHDGAGLSSSMRDGGVRAKTGIDWRSGRWVIAEVPLEADLDLFEREAGKGYDYLGLAGFVLPWRTDNPGRWFCSEIVAAALGLERPWQWSPNDLARLCEVTV